MHACLAKQTQHLLYQMSSRPSSLSATAGIQPAVTATTTYIPIHTTATTDDDDIPIWAMIEVNGELLEPKHEEDENSQAVRTSVMTGDPESIELGAVHFVDDKVRGKK